MAQGFVYVLVSPNSNWVKIGGTEKPIAERLRGINGTPSYSDHGPWTLSDFLHVTDWRRVEGELHKHFNKYNVPAPKTRELFDIAPHKARERLRLTNKLLRVGYETTGKLFRDRSAKLFLYRLFELSGLFGSLDLQGAWTLSILPKTSGGRSFTLNIGSHEVAFSALKPSNGKLTHFIVLDRLLLDYPDTVIWIGNHGGEVREASYRSAKRAVVIAFDETFAGAERFFKLDGVRRALVAYWYDALADLRERSAKSVFARYHSYDAVAELWAYKLANEAPFSTY